MLYWLLWEIPLQFLPAASSTHTHEPLLFFAPAVTHPMATFTGSVAAQDGSEFILLSQPCEYGL